MPSAANEPRPVSPPSTARLRRDRKVRATGKRKTYGLSPSRRRAVRNVREVGSPTAARRRERLADIARSARRPIGTRRRFRLLSRQLKDSEIEGRRQSDELDIVCKFRERSKGTQKGPGGGRRAGVSPAVSNRSAIQEARNRQKQTPIKWICP